MLSELAVRVGPPQEGNVKKTISPQKMQVWYLKIDSSKNWIWMELATVMRKNIKKSCCCR